MHKHFFLTYMCQCHSVTVYLEHLYCGIAHWNFPVSLNFFDKNTASCTGVCCDRCGTGTLEMHM